MSTEGTATTKPVVVYGVSGYTGRLICEYLREYNVPFIAAGRDHDRVAEVVSRIPGIETADHEIVEVEHTVEALTELFSGAQVVCNTVGPFIKFGDVVAEAALNAGAHYLDTTGEQDWMLAAKERWGAAFAGKGLLLSPGVAQMYTTGEIAANICLETPGLDTLDILVLWKGFPTYASMQTIFTILKADWFYLEENQYRKWPSDQVFEVSIPGQHETGIALPWGGTAHPVWFKDDPRVATVKAAGGVFDRSVMQTVIATTTMFTEQIKPLPPEEQEAALAQVAGSVQANMPPRENPRINTSLDSVYASGPLGRAHCVIHGNSNYKQTGLLQAYAAYSLIQQAPRRAGFASACQAFGHRELLGVLRSFGLVLEPVLTVNR
ncbi:saccharopine dehydrogenase [Nakamurella silvestris]|nr:saccharopine dehydrogenase [Nakamurella silvestris]